MIEKYEPLDTRDFVPFEDYEELNLESIKEACERFYDAPAGSRNILASDRGPSCTNFEQIKVAKFSSSDFLSQKRMPLAHFGLRKRHMSIHLFVPSLVGSHDSIMSLVTRNNTDGPGIASFKFVICKTCSQALLRGVITLGCSFFFSV